VRSSVDMSNFDTVFTTEQSLDSVIEGSPLSQTVQAQYKGASPSYYPNVFFFYRFLVQCTRTHRANGPRASPPPRPTTADATLIRIVTTNILIY
jgi:hypothetical protein